MATRTMLVERFAAATDALLRDGALPADGDPVAAEVSLAVRLRAAAAAGVPDPAFVEGLRGELRAAAGAARIEAGAVRYAVLDTEIGRLAIAYRNGRVLYCNAVGADDGGAPAAPTVASFERAVAQAVGARPVRDAQPPADIRRGVRDHLAGRRRFKAVDLSWLTPFQRRVLEKTAEIPRGEVRPYGWVAREIGAPGAARAVGTALGHNPIPFIIPCHRVVRADGTLGEYSGGGPAVKERVLAYEGAPVTDLLTAARRGERLRGSRTTHIVCYPSCRAARRIGPDNVVPFVSLSQAQRRGYRPCELCRPA